MKPSFWEATALKTSFNLLMSDPEFEPSRLPPAPFHPTEDGRRCDLGC